MAKIDVTALRAKAKAALEARNKEADQTVSAELGSELLLYKDPQSGGLIIDQPVVELKAEREDGKEESRPCAGEEVVALGTSVLDSVPRMEKAQQEVLATPLSAAQQIVQRIDDLQEALQKNLPGYEQLLFVIHKALLNDENTVHLLTEEQIGIIVAGLSRKKNIVITASAIKQGRTAGGKKLKDLSLADL